MKIPLGRIIRGMMLTESASWTVIEESSLYFEV
jgi:hypothetical protein